MPGSPTPYLTPPPSHSATACSSRRSSLNETALPNQHFLRRRSSLHEFVLPEYNLYRPHSQPPARRLNAQSRVLSSITDVSGGEDAEGDDEDSRSTGRADKRRRVTKSGKSVDIIPSPRKDSISGEGGSTSPSHHDSQSSSLATRNGRSNGSTLAPIKPIGFAAAREARRDDNGNQALPSPVVMGFDFKAIDEDQLKTVRDTISIKEQQQALIAARRREVAQSQPSTPKELTFKGWAPKDSAPPAPSAAPLPPSNNSDHSAPSPRESFSGGGPTSGQPISAGGVGRRREKTRDKVEKMSIVTSATERDVVPGSKSAPLNQGLASQQASPREPPSGSQTALPPHILPPLHGYGHHSNGGLTDPRTAPLSHNRSRNGEEHEFARQQGPYYNLPQTRPLARPYESQQNLRGPATTSDRRNFSVPSSSGANLHPPPSSARYEGIPSPRRVSGNTQISGGSGSVSTPSPRISREHFLQPFNQVYDLFQSTDQLKFNLQDLYSRYENLFSTQLNQMNEFKITANASNTLLNNLQQSADSLKELVRYEVERNNLSKDRELDELRDRLRRLEERDNAGEKRD